MKKMGKFRKWLIKKLGGELPCDKKVIITNVRHTKEYESTVKFSFYDYQCLCESNLTCKVKETLWEKLGEQILPNLYIVRNDNPVDMETTFKAKLTIIEE